jgi:tetratricopeptide (TPR) repeat protein
MSEMLANYHFIVRNYCNAIPELEEELQKNPFSKPIKKKLIICYTQTNKLQQAIKLFIQLIEEDINFIIETDQQYEDCPCPDLIAMIENETIPRANILNRYLELGILWLYCDREESYKYFLKAIELDKNNKTLLTIIDLLQKPKRSNHGKETD